MKKKQIDSKLALLEIETLVSNYTETEVDIFIGILCVRFMREYNISKEELLESLSGNIDRLTFVRKYLSLIHISCLSCWHSPHSPSRDISPPYRLENRPAIL